MKYYAKLRIGDDGAFPPEDRWTDDEPYYLDILNKTLYEDALRKWGGRLESTRGGTWYWVEVDEDDVYPF